MNMKKILKTLGVCLALSFAISASQSHAQGLAAMSQGFQQDADRNRLDVLLYWVDLIEEYHDRTGQYPLAPADGELVLTHIIHSDQAPYFTPGNRKFRQELYRSDLPRYRVSDFVRVLEAGLGREIDEYYDPQLVPTTFPIGPHYFTRGGGYLIWVPCPTCGVTSASTLVTFSQQPVPSVNIGSPDIVEGARKLFTREGMMANPDFQRWMARPISKPGFFEDRAQNYLHDSKTR